MADLREHRALSVLVSELVDDAGLFPPAELPMTEALARHRRDMNEGNPVMTGRFVCASRRLGELSAALEGDDPLRLCLIVSPLTHDAVDEALGAAGEDPRLAVECLEGPMTGHLPSRDLIAGRRAFAEISFEPGWPEVLDEVAAAGLSVKLRCGGLSSDLFPSAWELAEVVAGCAAVGLLFKATAGLHHAVRHRDEHTGFVHHGFLNLLMAASRAVRGGGVDAVADALLCEDGGELVTEAKALPHEAALATRGLFVSYGSCSTSEPLEDLVALGLLPPQVST